MKITYESFRELGKCMTEGGGLLHLFNCVVRKDDFYKDPCIAWQTGVDCFAEWLDHIGVKVNISDNSEDFYNFMASKYEVSKERQTNGTDASRASSSNN